MPFLNLSGFQGVSGECNMAVSWTLSTKASLKSYCPENSQRGGAFVFDGTAMHSPRQFEWSLISINTRQHGAPYRHEDALQYGVLTCVTVLTHSNDFALPVKHHWAVQRESNQADNRQPLSNYSQLLCGHLVLPPWQRKAKRAKEALGRNPPEMEDASWFPCSILRY